MPGMQLAAYECMRNQTKVLVGAIVLVSGVWLVGKVATARFRRAAAHDVRDLLSVPTSGLEHAPPALPAPVARYRDRAVASHPPVSVARMHHGGSFRTTPGGQAYPIVGAQTFTADPPGFVWSAEVQLAPAMWFGARDRSVAGKGSMRVVVDGLVPVVDASGPALDQGALLRLLAEMAWYPTAYFDARWVTWSPIDDHRARATLRAFGQEASATFVFGEDDLPARCEAMRPDDQGRVKSWGGVYRDYRQVDGLLVPFEAEVSWQLESGPFTYAHWRVDSIDFDTGPIFATGTRS